MSFLSGLSGIVQGIGIATQAAGVVTSFIGAQRTADAFDRQAVRIEELSEEERGAILAIGETEAQLIEAEGRDAADVLAFNEQVALSNAAWERRAGEAAAEQARRAWERQVKSVVAQFAATGARLTGSTNDVILEQVAEMERDLFLMNLNTERSVAQQTDQARMFSLQKSQVERQTRFRSEARRQVAAINADASETAAAARASAARTSAGTTRIDGLGDVIRGAGGLLGEIAKL